MDEVKKILIAEDEFHIAKAIIAILKKAFPGVVVEHAKNGEVALGMVLADEYCLIISDWNMPKMNGDQLLAEIRVGENSSSLPFVMLTARGDRDSVEEALAAGADDYVVKPFKTPEFVAKIKELIKE